MTTRPAASSEAAGSFLKPEKIHGISQSLYWKRLLHYRKNWKGTDRSEADGLAFFLSPRGQTDLEAELRADVEAFQNPLAPGVGFLHQHPQCAFPERYRFLKSELKFDAQDQPCPAFNEWKKSFNPQSVTLIYAAPYLGSPASMFGHTFMRIDSKPRFANTNKSDLLDYGISFEAETGPNPGPLYMLKGLVGAYPGSFNQTPYYLKINTYVNLESRDLWEYELDLTEEQISRMLNHVWETGTTHFNYFFFNRNCSYHLLSLLEVANTDWKLRENFTAMAIPSDTVRALFENNAVRKTKFRPSLIGTLSSQLAAMSEKERADFFRLRNHVDDVTGTESVATLDALLDWDKFRAMSESKAVYDPSKSVNMKLLLARARAATHARGNDTGSSGGGTESDDKIEMKIERAVSPEKGHRSSKLSVIGGTDTGTGLASLELRPAFQDLLDPDEGYLTESSLVIARTRVSLVGQKVRLDDFTGGEVINLSPLSRLSSKLSWRAGGGLFHPDDLACTDCLGGRAKGGLGASFRFFDSPQTLFYTLMNANAETSNGFHDLYGQNYRFGPSVESGLLFKISPHFKGMLEFEHYWYWPQASNGAQQWSRASAGLSYAVLPFELRLLSDAFFVPEQEHARATLALGWYY